MPVDQAPSTEAASPRSAWLQRFLPPAGLQPAWCVWGLWAVMSVALVGFNLKYRSPHPASDEWDMTPHMVDGAPLDWRTLWRQHNEHRIPAVRLALACLGRLTHGDFRPIALCVAAMTIGVSAMLLAAVRKLRGRTDWSDAAMPMLLLHFGHYELYVNSVALNLAAGSALALTALALALNNPQGLSGWRLAAVSTVLALGPMFGSSALMPAGAMAVWLLLVGLAQFRSFDRAGAVRGAGYLIAATPCLILTALYLVDLHSAPGTTKSAGLWETYRTLMQALTVSCFAKPHRLWPVAGPLGFSISALALVVLGWNWVRRPETRFRNGAAFCFLSAFGLTAVVIAVARAGHGHDAGLAARYAWTLVPIPIGLYLVGLTTQSPIACVWLQRAICLTALLSLPSQTKHGVRAAEGHSAEMQRFDRDLAAGVSAPVLAEQYRHILYPDVQRLHRHLLRMADEIHAPRYQNMGRSFPDHVARRIEPRLVAAHHLETQGGGAWLSNGVDPYLEFELPETHRTYAVRATFRLEVLDPAGKPLPHPSVTQLFWSPASNQPMSESHSRLTRLPPSSDPQSYTFWVDDSLSRLRLAPHSGPCRFTLHSLELLEPPAQVASQPRVD